MHGCNREGTWSHWRVLSMGAIERGPGRTGGC